MSAPTARGTDPSLPGQRQLRWGPVAALATPAGLLIAAAVLAAGCEGLRCAGAVVLVLAGAPTTIALGALVAVGLPETAAVALGIVTSLPLWAGLGFLLARRTLARAVGAPSWWGWLGRYITVSMLWVLLAVGALGLLAQL